MIIVIGVADCEPDYDCNPILDQENVSAVVSLMRSGAADG